MKNNIYTIIAEMEGGVLTGQVNDSSPSEAILSWINDLAADIILAFGLKIDELIDLLNNNKAEIDKQGSNFWVHTVTLQSNEIYMFYVVNTVE